MAKGRKGQGGGAEAGLKFFWLIMEGGGWGKNRQVDSRAAAGVPPEPSECIAN